jgi:hypothetical protein
VSAAFEWISNVVVRLFFLVLLVGIIEIVVFIFVQVVFFVDVDVVELFFVQVIFEIVVEVLVFEVVVVVEVVVFFLVEVISVVVVVEFLLKRFFLLFAGMPGKGRRGQPILEARRTGAVEISHREQFQTVPHQVGPQARRV